MSRASLVQVLLSAEQPMQVLPPDVPVQQAPAPRGSVGEARTSLGSEVLGEAGASPSTPGGASFASVLASSGAPREGARGSAGQAGEQGEAREAKVPSAGEAAGGNGETPTGSPPSDGESGQVSSTSSTETSTSGGKGENLADSPAPEGSSQGSPSVAENGETPVSPAVPSGAEGPPVAGTGEVAVSLDALVGTGGAAPVGKNGEVSVSVDAPAGVEVVSAAGGTGGVAVSLDALVGTGGTSPVGGGGEVAVSVDAPGGTEGAPSVGGNGEVAVSTGAASGAEGSPQETGNSTSTTSPEGVGEASIGAAAGAKQTSGAAGPEGEVGPTAEVGNGVPSKGGAAGGEAEVSVERTLKSPTGGAGRHSADVGSTGKPDADPSSNVQKAQPSESSDQPPAASRGGGGNGQHRQGEAATAELHSGVTASRAEPGSGGSASAGVGQSNLPDRTAGSASSGQAAAGGGEHGKGNGESGESKSGLQITQGGGEGDSGVAGELTEESEASQFSLRGALKAGRPQEPPPNGAGGLGNHGHSAGSLRGEGDQAGASARAEGASQSGESLAQSGPAARGSEAQSQPTADPRLTSSATSRAEQALNAELDRGFVGRLRDNGEMRLMVQRDELGELDLRVTVRESGVHASIATQHEEARQLLNGQRADLETALQRYNLRLDSFTVENGGRDGRSSLHRDQQQAGPSDGSQSGFAEVGERDSAPGHRPQSQDGSGGGLSVRV